MSKYEKHLEVTDEAIDALVNVFKENISHLEILRELIKDMDEEQFKKFMHPFAKVILPEMANEVMKSSAPIMATIDTVKFIKGENDE